ncbi:hypothetical protein ACHHYP_11490 [Achlya hypogyna]|uniref:Uncharacterized protein n=1 Tax=Achlya hypogyna TaxID=1202772 RepID=A0A1V9YJ37_ACHHY|nr:hypothetical protein ACHHYP_11490 [Achlya hypogyna]
MSIDASATPAPAEATAAATPATVASTPVVVPETSAVDAAKAQALAAKNQVTDSVLAATTSVTGTVAAWKSEVTTAVSGQVEAAKELTGATRTSIKRAGVLVWSTVKQPLAEVVQVIRDANSDKGTPIRSLITDARVSANDTLVSIEASTKETQATVAKSLEPVQDGLVVAKANAIKFNAFRKAYPAVVVGGAAALFGLPTLLRRGKVRGAAAAVAAAGLTAGGMFAADEVEKYLSR